MPILQMRRWRLNFPKVTGLTDITANPGPSDSRAQLVDYCIRPSLSPKTKEGGVTST